MLKIVNQDTFIKNTPLNIRQIHLFLKTICNKWYLSESLLSLSHFHTAFIIRKTALCHDAPLNVS
jgi:hypothetical protein